jgi:hypothetical protein
MAAATAKITTAAQRIPLGAKKDNVKACLEYDGGHKYRSASAIRDRRLPLLLEECFREVKHG